MTLYALDFDGVVCDSCNETGVSGLKAGYKLFPQVFEPFIIDSSKQLKILKQFRYLRPYLEFGYEAIIIMWLIIKKLPETNLEEMSKKLNSAFYEETMKEFNIAKQILVETFAQIRDHWIQSDENSWLQLHRMYEGVPEFLKKSMENSDNHLVIITTKQKRFTQKLLEYAGVTFLEENIYGLEAGPKLQVLKLLTNQYPLKKVLFFEDRLQTLEGAQKVNELVHVQLLLADWGYNDETARNSAKQNTRIRVISLANLVQL